VLVRGQGSRVWDENDKEYVDFGGGIAVLSLGHAPPILTAAISEQAGRLLHTSNLHVNDAAVHLAQKLVEETFAARSFLCNSGAEANEAAIKLARHHGCSIQSEKYHVLAFENSFHGRVGMAMAATGQQKIRNGFGPLTPGMRFAPFNDLAATAAMMDDDVCGIIVEPVQGEGGVVPAANGFLAGLRDLADRHKALLIFDEIQSGAGRTGHLYNYMETHVTPDVLTTAKGLGGGFPVAAMLVSEAAAAGFPVGAHGSTYGGNPLAARAALAVLGEILKDDFLEGVKKRENLFCDKLEELNNEFNCFSDIRHKGCLIGIDMAEGWTVKTVVATALDEGLIVITAGQNTLRLAPALNISVEDIDAGFARLRRALQILRI
jgi:acetylornithine/N-succinyldiaminopimelate aminotransferase